MRAQMDRRDFVRLGLAGAAGASGLLAGCGGTVPAPPDPNLPQVPGGRYAHGATGGGLNDTLDAHFPVTTPDIARVNNLYEPLFQFDFDAQAQPCLAESVEPNADATVWTVRLRPDVIFHNGKPMTADDVIFSLRRALDPDNPSPAASELSMLDPARIRRIDDRTVELPLDSAYAEVDQLLANYALGIVPTGYDPAAPIGTGPFAAREFAPGARSVFSRFDGYWRAPAFVDELIIYDFNDDAAKVNALLAGQVQSIDGLPQYLAQSVQRQGVSPLIAETGAWMPFTMRVDVALLGDVDVRNALRWAADRQQMIDQALSGYGTLANDVYSPFDPAYVGDRFEQREQDPERVRSLLRKAGREDLQLELVTSSAVGSGAVQSAQVFAEQARSCGIDVALRVTDSSVFYGERYLQWDFAMDFWNTRNYLAQVAQCALKDSPYNETHFDDAEFVAIIDRARRELDPGRRAELLGEAQRIEYERGGYLIPFFKQQVDAHSNLVQGLRPSRFLPMSGFRFQYASLVRP